MDFTNTFIIFQWDPIESEWILAQFQWDPYKFQWIILYLILKWILELQIKHLNGIAMDP